MTGILAVWNDCRPGDEADYEGWYMTEHLPERVGAPGFRTGRRLEALVSTGERKFFTWYEVDSLAVLTSKPYMALLDNPTPWTQRIMGSGTFQRIIRAVCERESVSGARSGAFAAVARFDEAFPAGLRADELHRRVGDTPGICRVQVWRSALAPTPETKESRARGGADKSVAGAVVIECAREADLAPAIATLQKLVANGGAVISTYRLVTHLDHRDVKPT